METMKIHEIPGFRFGQVEDLEGGTGCTVILCPDGAVTRGGCPGRLPGTRDTDALSPVCNREVVHGWCSPGAVPSGWMLPVAS